MISKQHTKLQNQMGKKFQAFQGGKFSSNSVSNVLNFIKKKNVCRQYLRWLFIVQILILYMDYRLILTGKQPGMKIKIINNQNK